MDSILETQRSLHEERERVIDTVVKEMMSDKRTHKGKINSEQRVKKLVERYLVCTDNLELIYRDADGARAREIDAISGPNEFAEFYGRLKVLRETHRRNPEETAEPLSVEFKNLHDAISDANRPETDMVDFTDEEGYGRFLDVHASYGQYINLKGIKGTKKIDYIAYLGLLNKFEDIPRNSAKKTGAYKDYLLNLKGYLLYFIERTRPLYDLADDFAKSDAFVYQALADGSLPGWSTEKAAGAQPSAIELGSYTSATELEGLGLERLKGALLALNLKCGGTLKERAERLYSTKGHKLSDIEKTALSKKNDEKEKEMQRIKLLAQVEGHIKSMCHILHEEIEATKENVERKQARAVGEVEEEDDEPVIESDEEVDDSIPYNPKNLPLDWDGKPIPYWLYKLHGLNHSYSCEICGNQAYKGPKAFQKHFLEWRHSHSMRCLGIPNTAHFANITKIKDALDLWNKLRLEKETNKWNPDHDEEYEDSSGNVVTKKMYQDLKRQGLL